MASSDPFGLLDRRSLDVLFSAMYEELRRLAATIKRADPSATLNPTALVNEAWMKLAQSPRFRAMSHLHFKRIAARAMRQVLVDAARRRRSAKRDAAFVAIDDNHAQPVTLTSDAIIALDTALDELAEANPRQALLVESRYFGGLDVAQTATLLDVSEATVQRDWRAARAWLASRVDRASRV